MDSRNLDRPPAVTFVTPFGAEQGGGGGVYTGSVIALLRAALSGEALGVICPPPRKPRWPWFERALCVAISAFGSDPAKAIYSRRSGLGRLAASCHRRLGAKTLVVNGADSYWFVDTPAGAADRRVLICHNIEAALYEAQIDTRRPIERFILRRLLGDDEKFRRLEARAFGESDLVICISSEDAAEIRKRYPATPTHHLPPTFDYTPFRVRHGPPPPRPRDASLRIGFLAKFGWWPNDDAVHWFAGEIMPRLPRDRELHLFGLGSERFHRPVGRVFAHGFVDDLDEVWRALDIVVCPMRRGGGVNVKFAEALYNGLPVCSTALAARGLGVDSRDGPGLKFLGDADDWVSFLGSDAARAFAAGPGSATLGEAFAFKRQVQPLRSALENFVMATDD